MQKTNVNGPLGNSQRAARSARFGGLAVTGVVAWAAALLVSASASIALADVTKAAPPAAAPPAASAAAPAGSATPAAPPASPGAAPATVPAALPPPAAAAPIAPVATGPYVAPKDFVFKRVEIFGMIVSNTKKGFGAKAVTQKGIMQSLVITTSDPLKMNQKGILYRKFEKPGDLSGTTWAKVADITIRKLDGANRVSFDVDGEEKGVLVDGKPADHFKKNVKVKIQIDVPVEEP